MVKQVLPVQNGLSQKMASRVCDGEKTTVKAVGQDATPEVKKENGKWYLWNGTEYEEFTGAVAPATNIPYYYADTQDPQQLCDFGGL